MDGFRILKKSDDFTPEISELPAFEGKELISSSSKSSRNGIIYFMPSALKDLDEHIHWGEKLHVNLVEQGGYMLGNVYQDPETDIIFAIISCLVPVHGAKGSEAFLDMGTDASYDATLRENEILQERNHSIRRIGWYHTHPGGLGVFMSGTDMMTQTKSYYHDWQFAVVLNPQRKIWRGFRGAQANEVDCIMVCDSKDPVTGKFIQKSHYSLWDLLGITPFSEYDDTYEADFSGQKSDQIQSPQYDMLSVKIDGESIYLGDCIMSVDTFMSRLYSSITKDMSAAEVSGISLDLLLQPQIEEDRLEFSDITILNYAVNLTVEEQFVTKYVKPDPDTESQENSVHAMVHLMEYITDKEAFLMSELYDFTSYNELFCIFSIADDDMDDIIRYFVFDRDRNKASGELPY